jgi:NAD(P)-dependent dehydrogenase (short-subunit alcohol dehydrogenase family)
VTELRVNAADLLDFAAATGDHNPLHLDAEFARRSTFGQPVAHGVLAAAATLALTRVDLTSVAELAIDFDLPVLPGLCYRAHAEPGAAVLRLGDIRVLAIRWVSGRRWPDPEPAGPAGRPPAGRPRVLDGGQVVRLPAETGTYRPDLRALSGLLRRVAGAAIPARLAGPLAWASFFAGMRTPGRDALLASVRLSIVDDRGDPAPPWTYRVARPRFDARTGLVTLDARLAGRCTVEVTVSAFLRHPVELPRFADTAALPRSDRLAGRRVAVIGGSRGLGAALACCLAGQGAQVRVVSSRPPPADLVRLASAERLPIEPVCCDATDAGRLGAVLDGGGLDGAGLDGVVLAAAPRVVGLPLRPEAVPACLAHIDEALRLALTPLAVAGPQLRDGSFVLFISSIAMTRSQPLWPHYVAGKAALEGLAGHVARHHRRWRVVVARPPRMWTEMANGPAGALGAASPAAVAAVVVARLLGPAGAPGTVQLIDADAFAGPTTAR